MTSIPSLLAFRVFVRVKLPQMLHPAGLMSENLQPGTSTYNISRREPVTTWAPDRCKSRKINFRTFQVQRRILQAQGGMHETRAPVCLKRLFAGVLQLLPHFSHQQVRLSFWVLQMSP